MGKAPYFKEVKAYLPIPHCVIHHITQIPLLRQLASQKQLPGDGALTDNPWTWLTQIPSL